MKAQQRNSPRMSSGDRNKPPKAKEKKDPKEAKESVSKTKDDKVSWVVVEYPDVRSSLFAIRPSVDVCLPDQRRRPGEGTKEK